MKISQLILGSFLLLCSCTTPIHQKHIKLLVFIDGTLDAVNIYQKNINPIIAKYLARNNEENRYTLEVVINPIDANTSNSKPLLYCFIDFDQTAEIAAYQNGAEGIVNNMIGQFRTNFKKYKNPEKRLRVLASLIRIRNELIKDELSEDDIAINKELHVLIFSDLLEDDNPTRPNKGSFTFISNDKKHIDGKRVEEALFSVGKTRSWIKNQIIKPWIEKKEQEDYLNPKYVRVFYPRDREILGDSAYLIEEIWRKVHNEIKVPIAFYGIEQSETFTLK